MVLCLSVNIPLTEPDTENTGCSALVRRAVAGETRAFEALYREHVGRMYGTILRLVGMDRSRAEELTQEAFVRAWQKLSSFRHESAFSTWLHRLGVNTALMELRGRRETESVDSRYSGTRRGDVPFCAAERGDLEKAVAALPPRARAVLVLHDVEGWKHEEISKTNSAWRSGRRKHNCIAPAACCGGRSEKSHE